MPLTLHTDSGDLVYQPGYYCTRGDKILVVLRGSTYHLEFSQVVQQLSTNIGELLFFEITSWIQQYPHLPGVPIGVGTVLKDRIVLEESIRTDYYRTPIPFVTEDIEFTLNPGQTVN